MKITKCLEEYGKQRKSEQQKPKKTKREIEEEEKKPKKENNEIKEVTREIYSENIVWIR